MQFYDKQYKNIYLVSAIIAACFVFMIFSTVIVLDKIGGGKTSADIAIEQARKDCAKQKGELVQLTKNNPLNTACIVGPDGKPAQ